MSSRLVLATLALVGTLTVRQAYAEGGNILPPNARPHGYTLAEMAKLNAVFASSGNTQGNPQALLPFQMLYYDPSTLEVNLVGGTVVLSGINTFNVDEGTMFFVPIFGFDDSPPIVGSFPANSGTDAWEYLFGEGQVGADNAEIEVDGQVTSLGPEYVAGPVVTPPLLDGGGTHFIQVGAFLTPLSEGEHTITCRVTLDGTGFLGTYGSPFAYDLTYTVIVK
jgi:hypothetical protein